MSMLDSDNSFDFLFKVTQSPFSKEYTALYCMFFKKKHMSTVSACCHKACNSMRGWFLSKR